MIWYFCKGLKLFIWAKIKQRSQKLDSFEKLVEKIKNVKAKAALQAYSGIYEIYQYCFSGNWLKKKLKAKPIIKILGLKNLKISFSL